MAIDAAAEDLHGVVQVHALQVAEPYDALQLGEGRLAGFGRAQVVARGEGVAGVDADAHARFVLHAVDEVGEGLETGCQGRDGAGGVLVERRHAVRFPECDVDRLGDAVEALLLGDLLQVAPGMEVEPVESELLAAAHLVQKGGARLFEPLLFGVPEVDQVGVVGQDLCRGVAGPVAGAAEGVDLRRGERCGDPLPLVLGEECEGRGAYRLRIPGGVLHTARGADMCSEIVHVRSCPLSSEQK